MDAQLQKIFLGTLTYAAGQPFSINFDLALAQLIGRVPHLRKISLHGRGTPTLSSGTLTAEELSTAMKTLTIKDAVRTYFDGSGRSLRFFEMLERGRLYTPEPDPAATTEQINFTRTFDLALPEAYDPSDYLQPLAVFKGGSISGTWEALATIDANLTGLALSIDVYAHVTILDDVIFGTLLERKEAPLVSGVAHAADALYAFLGLAKSNVFAALAAGDLSTVKVQTMAITQDAFDVRHLRDQFYEDMKSGGITQLAGEPRAATDDNAKQPAVTALAAAPFSLQPVLWAAPRFRTSKLIHETRAASGLVLTIGGTTTSPWGLMSRLIPRTGDFLAKYTAAMNVSLPINLNAWEMDTRAFNKSKEYVGGRKEYLPLKFRHPQKAA